MKSLLHKRYKKLEASTLQEMIKLASDSFEKDMRTYQLSQLNKLSWETYRKTYKSVYDNSHLH